MLNDLALSHTFAALADPTRRAMLTRLSEGPAPVSELASPLRMTLPAVLQHLRALESSGLVRSEKRGRVRTVRLEPGALGRAEDWLVKHRKQWEALHDRFDDYVSALETDGDD